MNARAALVRALASTLVLAPSLALITTPQASAVDHTRGKPGFCPTEVGVTVVIDFGELGGEPLVRCNPTSSRGSGLDALKGAGIQLTGVQRWGESFICRIENKPSSSQSLSIPGDSSYREACIDTPPAEAYWSYWHAGNNCAWTYSQWGVKNRDFVQGGFEGWTFSLGASAEESAQGRGPRIAAVRPGTEGGSCGAAAEPAPTTDDRDEKAPSATSRTPGSSGSTGPRSGAPDGSSTGTSADEPEDDRGDATSAPGEGSTGALRALPRQPGDQPSDQPASPGNVTWTGGEDAPDLSDSGGGDRGAAVLVTGVLALLAAGVWSTRRRRASDAARVPE